jgi:hypothetical protein
LSNLVVEILSKHKSLFETALAHESGDPGVLFEKKSEVKNLVIMFLKADN